ncbi:hypothetical protein H105_02645 [Trichophyton soudanense CBS 452.61]|uniref:Very-long-chain (3R)-3-hydroxyacyl-CoA dehydratase n=1 Tax=Trichophyton soudanense CBS 452.61 TaxID=1215331 RepID=A0A022XZI8_TRISD|nr:hypothetical protein H105_02645 [Trichophyton soudanense CBS 452.61]
MASSRSSMPASSPTQAYLFLYNLVSLGLWSTLTFRLLFSLFQLYSDSHGSYGSEGEGVSGLFVYLFPLLRTTQSLAALEILHSLFGLVRASAVTTTMQVASRLLLVWGVMYVFSPFSPTLPIFEFDGTGVNKYFLLGHGMRSAQLSDWGFIGCLFAWGVTECIRYGFFVFQISGQGIPKAILWLRLAFSPSHFPPDSSINNFYFRYNTFFILYPVGISSECFLIYLTVINASGLLSIFRFTFIAILLVYIPGMANLFITP